MNDEKKLPATKDEPDHPAEADAGDQAESKDERSPEEQQAEIDLLKSSGGNPLTQEG